MDPSGTVVIGAGVAADLHLGVFEGKRKEGRHWMMG